MTTINVQEEAEEEVSQLSVQQRAGGVLASVATSYVVWSFRHFSGEAFFMVWKIQLHPIVLRVE